MPDDTGSKAALDSFAFGLSRTTRIGFSRYPVPDKFTHPSGHSFTLSTDGGGYVHDDDCELCEVSRRAEADRDQGTGQ